MDKTIAATNVFLSMILAAVVAVVIGGPFWAWFVWIAMGSLFVQYLGYLRDRSWK